VLLAGAALLFLKTRLDNPIESEGGTVAIEVGSVLPDFHLHAQGSSPIRVSSLKKKVLVINFWASWCDSCLVEMPSLVRLREGIKDTSFEVIGVNVDENPETVIPRLKEKLKISFPLYGDTDQKLSALFDVHAIPLTVIVDRDRKILHVEAGERDWNSQDIREKIVQWLSG